MEIDLNKSLGFSLYEGYIVTEAPEGKITEKSTLKKFKVKLVTDGIGKCMCCREEKEIHFYHGMWMCSKCLYESVREEIPEEDVEDIGVT